MTCEGFPDLSGQLEPRPTAIVRKDRAAHLGTIGQQGQVELIAFIFDQVRTHRASP